MEGREARLRTGTPRVEGETVSVVAYFNLVGRLEGHAVCVTGGDFVLTIKAPRPKLDRLRRQFALLAALHPDERDDLRGHRRVVPDVCEVVVTLPDGTVTDARLLDLSRSDAAVLARRGNG